MTFEQRPERNERGVCSRLGADGCDAMGLSDASGMSAGAAEPPGWKEEERQQGEQVATEAREPGEDNVTESKGREVSSSHTAGTIHWQETATRAETSLLGLVMPKALSPN